MCCKPTEEVLAALQTTSGAAPTGMRKGMVADTLSRKVHRLRGTAAADGLSHPSPAPGHSGHSARLSGAWPMASGGREGAQSVDPTKGTQRVLIPSQQGTIPSPASRRPLSPSSRARPLRAQRARLCDARPVASGEQEGAQPVNQSKGGPLGMGWSPTGWDVDPRLTDRRQRAMAAHGMSADARRLHASAWPLRGTKSPCRASELACFSPCST